MQKRKSFFNNEMEQRFSLRKYTIGLCSVCLGFVVIGMGSQTVKADTVNDVEKSSAVQENKTQDVDSANTDALAESKANTSDSVAAKSNTTPTETKENEAGSVVATAPKTNTTLTGANANAANLEKAGALTTANQTSPEENAPAANEASKANEAAIAEPVKQNSVANGKSDVPDQVHLKLQQKMGTVANKVLSSAENKMLLANLAENKVANDTGVTTPVKQDGAANEKLIGTGKKASVSLSDGSTLTISNDVLDDQNTSAILTFKSGSFKAGDTYQIKVPKKGHLYLDKVNVASLPQGMGTTTFTDSDENYWVITDNFTSTGTVKQDIKINRYESSYYLKDYIRNLYHNSIQLSKNSEENANLNIDEIDKTYGLNVDVHDPYNSGNSLLFNNDENRIASYDVGITMKDSRGTLPSSDNIHISNTIKNLDWAIPDKVLVNGKESDFTYDSNDKELIVPLNSSDGTLHFDVDVMGRVNVDPGKFDSYHKLAVHNEVGVRTKINNVEQSNSDTIKNIVIDSVQNLTVGDMFQIDQAYEAGYYDNQYPTPITYGEYNVNDGNVNYSYVSHAQDTIRDSGIINIQNITGKTLDNVSVDADIPDGIDLTNVDFISNVGLNEREKVDIKTIISYTDGSSDIFNTSEIECDNDVLNPNNHKKIKHIKLELNEFNPGLRIKLLSSLYSNLSSVQKENTKIAEKYADGTPVAPGDLITFKETISANGQKDTVDTGYLRLVDHNHDKYNLDLGPYPHQNNKSPNVQDAGNVGYTIDGIKPGDSPVVYIRVPKNATLTGDKPLFRTDPSSDNNTPINYQLLHVGDSVFMKVQLPKNTSGSARLTVHYGTIPDGQTSEDQLAYAVSGIDTDSYNHKHDSMHHSVFADYCDGNIEYDNSPEISNDFNALFKREGINLKDVAYSWSGYSSDGHKVTILESTWDVLTSEGISTISMTDSNMNPMPNMDSTQNVHGEHPDTFNIYGSIINATDQTIKGATQVINVPDSSDGKSQFNPVLNGPIHLIDALTGNDLSGLVEITYSTQKSDLNDPESTISGVSADQVTDWSQIKSVQVHFRNNSLPVKTSARAVLTLKDSHIYDDIGKTIYASNKTFTKDQQTGEFELLPTVIKPGSTNSAKLTVTGQAKVHTLIHYGDQYIELPDKLKTYAELNDVMQRSDFLNSDADLTDQDRALLPANIAIDYAHPTIKNSDETYVDGYNNGLAEFGKQAKYDFNNDSVVFNAQDMKLVTDNKDVTETIHYVYKDGPKKGQKAAEDAINTVTFTKTGYQNPFTGETKWANNAETKEFKAIDSPVITNYTPDSETIDAITVNQNSDNIVKTVSYNANRSNLHVIYQDDTDQQELSHKDFLNGIIGDSANYNTNDAISNYRNQHYDLVSDETNGQNLTYQDTDKTYVVHFKHHISNVDETSKSTQTVHYVASDNSAVPSDAKHEVSYSRTNQHDDVTGKITNYGTWGPIKTLPDVPTPEKKGYTPDYKEVKGTTTTPGKSEDFKTIVTYTPDKQKAKVVFIDDTDHQTLKTVNKDGVTKGDSGYSTRQDIQNYENQHYVLVSDTSGGFELIFDDDDLTDQYYEVHFVHGTKKVSRNDDVNMTVHYVMDDSSKAPSDNKQTVNFTENGTQDLVTQKITWTPADSQTLNDVKSPVLTGYTADIKTVNGKAVNFGDPDINVTVTYHANAQTAKITYIDVTTKNNLDSKDANGKFGQVITFKTAPTDEIASYEKQGYVLVSNSFDNNKYQANNNNNVFYVHFVHGTKKVSREHSASFTVHYIYKDGKQAKPDHEQTLSFTEDGIQDLVTQKITWTPADSQKFDDAITPVITGYTPDQDKVIGQIANFETGNREVTVTYLPDVQLGHINYIDDNTGKILTRDDFSGRTNEHEDYTSIDRIQEFENKGYIFVSSDYPDGGFNFDDNDGQDQVFNVHLKHGIVTVTSKNPQIPNTTIDPDPHSPKYPEDISNINSDVKRTIDYKFKDGKTAQPTVNDSLHFERTVVIDKVTGDVLSDTWTPSQNFNDVQTPIVQGYTPDRAVVSDKNIGHDHQNIVEHVVYNPDAQHMTITYIDDTTGATLHTDNLNGVSDQDAKYTTGDIIKQYNEQHYKLVSDSTNGQDLIFDHDDNADQTYEVHFVHNTHTINQTTSPKQTIHYVYADDLARHGKAADDNVQKLSFKRDGYNDEVTGIDHWNAWTPANSNYSAVDSPVIQGYTPDKSVIEKSTVNPTDKDTEITVVYNADKQAARVIYVDKTTNTTLTSNNLSGKSDKDSGYNTKDTIEKYQSQHYVLTSDETNGNNVIFDHDDKQDQTYYVYFVHGTQKVNRQDTVTSTIEYKFEDGKIAQPTVTQTKQFSEDGVKDLVTGKTTWDKAESQKFDDIATKSISGYTPDKDKVAGSTVNFGDSDIEVTVTYHNNAQTAKITYIDDTAKKTLASDSQNGKFDHEITFEHDPAEVINGLEEKGYKLVSNDFEDGTKYKADDKQNEFIVHLIHDKQKVNRQDQVIETIHYVYENGSKSQPDHEQTISFTEDGIKDKVTGQIDWTSATPQKFDDVATPAISGYTPDKSNVTGSTVNFGDSDIEVTVIYHNNAQTAKITYVDDTAKKTLASDSQDGKFNQVITFEHDPAEVINGLEEKGYKLVSNDFEDGTKYKADDKQNEFIVHLTHDKQKVNRQDTVTSTIDYKFEDGKTAQPTVTQTKHFSEDGIKDLVTGEITWTPADSQAFENVVTPKMTGYTPDKDNVVGGTVKFGDKDVEVTVTYHNNAQTAKITYIDDTEKKTLGSEQQNGKFDHEIVFEHDPAEVIKGWEEKGYKLVSNDFKQGIKYQADNKSNSFEVHLVHTYEPVETSQTITETVHYIDANGKPVAPDHVATVVIKVTGTRDKVTDSITWDTPSTGHFDEVISPEVPNMTPDKKFIPSRNVQYGDSDITENVVYTSDETSREPEKPNDQDKPNSKTPEKPNKSGNPTSKTSEKSNKSSKEVSKQFGTIAKTTIPEKPIDSCTVDNHVSAKTTTKRELPQTGTTANTGIWTGLVSIITSLGLLGASKKRKKN